MKRQKKKPPAAKKAARRRPAKTATRAKSVMKARGKSRAPAAAKPSDIIDALMMASAEALSLPIKPAWRAGVKFNLKLILSHAALVDEFPLADDTEPAPVFHA